MVLVTVRIDIAHDDPLLVKAQNESRIAVLLQIYGALDQEDDRLREISRLIWRLSEYGDRIWEICQEDIYDFNQSSVWVYEFKTSPDNAYLVKLALPVPKIVSIRETRLSSKTEVLRG